GSSPDTRSSRWTPGRRCSSPTHTRPGSDRRTRTPTACCASTSPRAPTSLAGRPEPSRPSLWPSTIAPAKSSTGRPPTGSSPNSYARSNSPVLHQPIELAQYTSIRYIEHLDLEGIAPSIGTVGDAYDDALMESVNGLVAPPAALP